MKASSCKIAKAFYDGVPPKIIKPPPYKTYQKDEVFKNAKVKLLKDGMCRVTCFSRSVYLLDGFERNEAFERAELLQMADKSPVTKTEGERKRVDSLKRAKDKIFEIAACNDWDYMVTFTLDSGKVDRYEPKEIIKPFGKWLDNMVQRRGLKALIIPEHHKDGAIHFHGLINNSLKMTSSGTFKVKGSKRLVRASTLRKLGKSVNDSDIQEVFNVDDYKLGFSTAVKLDGNVTAVSFYMTKYATKELDKIFGSYYFAVGKIQRELPYILCNLDIEELKHCGKVIDLPDSLGQVVYATITKDDLEGALLWQSQNACAI